MLALFTLVLAGAAAATLAELARLALARARLDRDGVAAWFLAEAGLADTAAAIPGDSDFTAALAGAAEPLQGRGPAGTYATALEDDSDDDPEDPTVDANGLAWLRVTAFGPPPVRRRLEALLARDLDGLFPGAATLAGGVRELAPALELDGRDFDAAGGCATLQPDGPARYGLTLPAGASLPVLAQPERLVGAGPAPSVARVPPPDLTPLATSPRGLAIPAGPLPAAIGTPAAPVFARIDGDTFVDSATTGDGVLYIAGRLRVSGALAFRGIVAVAGGIEVATTGEILICGALWAAGDPALTGDGSGTVRASTAAVRAAARLAPLPARVRVLATAEIS